MWSPYSVALVLMSVGSMTSSRVDVNQKRQLKSSAVIPAHKRLVADAAHRPAVKAAPVRPKAAAVPARKRVALVTKPGATIGTSTTIAGETHIGTPVPAPTLHPTSIPAPYIGGPPLFTTRIIRTTSATTTSTSKSTTTPTTTSSSTTTRPTTSSSSSTSTSTSSTTGTTCSSCSVGYYEPCLASQTCSGPCCAPGMICSYSVEGNGKCFPPLSGPN